MSTPKKIERYSLYYHQLAALAMNGRISRVKVSRFPPEMGCSAETTRARVCAFRTLLRAGTEAQQLMGDALDLFAVKAELGELVLSPKGMGRTEKTLPGYDELASPEMKEAAAAERRARMERIAELRSGGEISPEMLKMGDEIRASAARMVEAMRGEADGSFNLNEGDGK